MVDPLELAGPLESEYVERLLDDAQPPLIPRRIGANRAERRLADVEAPLAEDDTIPDIDESLGQRPSLSVGRPQQVIGQSLGRLGADAG